jgi:hypothetical protein
MIQPDVDMNFFQGENGGVRLRSISREEYPDVCIAVQSEQANEKEKPY